MANSTYNVTGKTLHDVVKTFKARPGGEAGKLDWFAKVGTAGGVRRGRVTGATLDLTRTKTMPVWSQKAAAPKSAQDEWDRFYKALDGHEDGHASRAATNWTNFASEIEGKRTRKATRMYDKRKAKGDKLDKSFDSTTDHGRKQGAALYAAKDPRKP